MIPCLINGGWVLHRTVRNWVFLIEHETGLRDSHEISYSFTWPLPISSTPPKILWNPEALRGNLYPLTMAPCSKYAPDPKALLNSFTSIFQIIIDYHMRSQQTQRMMKSETVSSSYETCEFTASTSYYIFVMFQPLLTNYGFILVTHFNLGLMSISPLFLVPAPSRFHPLLSDFTLIYFIEAVTYIYILLPVRLFWRYTR